jgi:hypothetical protein
MDLASTFLDDLHDKLLLSLVLYHKGTPAFEPNYSIVAQLVPTCLGVCYARNDRQEVGAKTLRDEDGTHKQ